MAAKPLRFSTGYSQNSPTLVHNFTATEMDLRTFVGSSVQFALPISWRLLFHESSDEGSACLDICCLMLTVVGRITNLK